MARSILTLIALALATVIAEPAAWAEERPRPPPPTVCNDFRERQHLLGFVLDVGAGPTSFGPRFLHSHNGGGGCGGLGGFGWLAYGVDARVVPGRAVVGHVVGRAGGLGDAGGGSFELGLGAGTGSSRTSAVGIAGLFASFYYLDLGVSVQFAFARNRPEWLQRVGFALRIHVPVHTYARSERTRRVPGS